MEETEREGRGVKTGQEKSENGAGREGRARKKE